MTCVIGYIQNSAKWAMTLLPFVSSPAADEKTHEIAEDLILARGVIGAVFLNGVFIAALAFSPVLEIAIVSSFGRFFISILAETNRPPFDLPEAEALII